MFEKTSRKEKNKSRRENEVYVLRCAKAKKFDDYDFFVRFNIEKCNNMN